MPPPYPLPGGGSKRIIFTEIIMLNLMPPPYPPPTDGGMFGVLFTRFPLLQQEGQGDGSNFVETGIQYMYI